MSEGRSYSEGFPLERLVGGERWFVGCVGLGLFTNGGRWSWDSSLFFLEFGCRSQAALVDFGEIWFIVGGVGEVCSVWEVSLIG